MRNLDLAIRGWVAKGAHQARQKRWCHRRAAKGQRDDSNFAVDRDAIKGNFLFLLQYAD